MKRTEMGNQRWETRESEGNRKGKLKVEHQGKRKESEGNRKG